ncbi:MAG: ABC transporter permease [Anaerolineales bacterium]
MTTTDTTVSALPSEIRPPQRTFRWRVPPWLWQNPILIKDLRGRMRGMRSLLGLTIYIGLVSLAIVLIYSSITSINSSLQVDTLQTIGRSIFFTVYGIELIVVCMASPAVTAGAISTEKEQQTYDLLRTTLLSARALVLGKLLAAISYVILFIIATIPLQALALIFGGLTPAEIILSQLILILTALAFGSVGIFFSSFITKTRLATGAAQFTSLALVLVIPLMLLMATILFDNRWNFSQRTDLEQILFLAIIWLIGITSPTITAVFTELFFYEELALFFVTQQLPSGNLIYIPSPWLGFVILYPILILLLLSFAIRNVKKVET